MNAEISILIKTARRNRAAHYANIHKVVEAMEGIEAHVDAITKDELEHLDELYNTAMYDIVEKIRKCNRDIGIIIACFFQYTGRSDNQELTNGIAQLRIAQDNNLELIPEYMRRIRHVRRQEHWHATHDINPEANILLYRALDECNQLKIAIEIGYQSYNHAIDSYVDTIILH
jgi:hypothetical protein